jgi:hypothetical protein
MTRRRVDPPVGRTAQFIVGYLIAQLGPQWHLTYGQSSTILQ